MQGIEINKHGIRMDLCIMEYEGDSIVSVYDIEPNRYNAAELPRRSRFSQSITDVKLLRSGAKYATLPEYVSIWIVTEDPFGANQMVYIVKNTVENHLEIKYNDGVTKMFLYVDGAAPGKSKLRDLLQFFKTSSKANATDSELQQLHGIVEEVKLSPEERERYMTFEDFLEYEKQEARDKAYEAGRNEGRGEGIVATISALKEFNVPAEQILQTIASKFLLSDEEAKKYLESNL